MEMVSTIILEKALTKSLLNKILPISPFLKTKN